MSVARNLLNDRKRTEIAVRTKVQDLCSMSASFRMQGHFFNKFSELQPLLRNLDAEGERLASFASSRIQKFVQEYERLGRPTEIKDSASQSYLRNVQEFADLFMDTVLDAYPPPPYVPSNSFRRSNSHI